MKGPFQVSAGGATLNSGTLIDVNAIWYHPRYDATYSQNDIALLHLKSPAGVTRLGNLPTSVQKNVGNKFLIVGWGRDQNGNLTGKLHRLTLNNEAKATKKFFKSVFNPKTMIGAGRYFPDEVLYGGGCTGDSGGPLFKGPNGGNRVILGITSFGARGCTVYQPTVFTSIGYYIKDLNRGINLLNSRAATSPIATGKATPIGVGPTTTTTLAPATKPIFIIKPVIFEYVTKYGGVAKPVPMVAVSTGTRTRDGKNVLYGCDFELAPNSSTVRWFYRWNVLTPWGLRKADSSPYSWDVFDFQGIFREAYALQCEVEASNAAGTTIIQSTWIAISPGN